MGEMDFSCQMVEARTWREAFQLLHSFHPDIIFLDLNLPELSGHEILACLKQHAQWRSIPAVMLSTSAAERDVKRSYQLKADGYLVKPFDFLELVSSIQETLHRWMPRRGTRRVSLPPNLSDPARS